MTAYYSRSYMQLLALSLLGLVDPTVARAEDGSFRTDEVESVKSVTYYDGPDADRVKHKCDVFYPRRADNCPVVVLVHGGVWMIGDKSCMGLYSAVGKFLARNGIVAVLPNYRLTPWVKHPEHVKDGPAPSRGLRETAADMAGEGTSYSSPAIPPAVTWLRWQQLMTLI